MERIIEFVKRNIFLLIAIILSISLLFLINENTSKVIVLEIFVWLWFLLGKRFKDFTYSSILLLFLVLPFNLSFQIPLASIDPYVNGVFTNYLVPTVSILDLFAGILLLSAIIEGNVSKKEISWEISLLAIFAGIKFLFDQNIVSLLGSMRILLYLLSFKVILNARKITGDKKIGNIIKGLILFETAVSILQFCKGSSLGISFLGESVFSSGMKGSNFVDLGGSLYIRGYSTFPHPNILAGWLLLSMTFLKRSKTGMYFQLMASLGVLLTFSRIGVLLTAVFWILSAAEFLRMKKTDKGFSFFPSLIIGRINDLFIGGDSSISDRRDLLRESIYILKRNWSFGCGYNNFVREMGERMPKTSNEVWLNQPVHNILMLSLSEMGVVGTVLLVLSYWKTFLLNTVDIKERWNFFIFLVIILVGAFDHYLFSLPQGLMIGMTFLILMHRNGESGIRTHGTR